MFPSTMFKARRDELLNIAIFRPRPIDCIQVVEARKYAGVGVPAGSERPLSLTTSRIPSMIPTIGDSGAF